MHEKPPQRKAKTHEKVIIHTREEKPVASASKESARANKATHTKVESPERIRMREDVSDARAKMIVAESAYLRAVRLNQKGHSTETHKGRVSELRDVYDQSRADFSNKVNESVRTRLNESEFGMTFVMKDDPGETVIKKVSYTEAQKKEIERRHNSMVLTRDTIDRAHDRSVEALMGNERGIFKKVFGWYARANNRMETKIARLITRRAYEYLPQEEKSKKLKTARRITRGLRILTFAGIGGLAGGIAGAGYYLFRYIGSVLLGSFAGKGVGKHFMKTKGAQRAQDLAGERKKIDSASIKSIRALDLAYKKGSPDAIEKSRRRREMFTAVLLGAGASIGSADILSRLPVMDAVEKSMSRLPSASHGIATTITDETHSAMHSIGDSASDEAEKLLGDIYNATAPSSHGAATVGAAHSAAISATHESSASVASSASATSVSHLAHAPVAHGALASASRVGVAPETFAGGAPGHGLAPAHAGGAGVGGGSPDRAFESYQTQPDTAIVIPFAPHSGVASAVAHHASATPHEALATHATHATHANAGSPSQHDIYLRDGEGHIVHDGFGQPVYAGAAPHATHIPTPAHIPQNPIVHMENISGAHAIAELHSELATHMNEPIAEVLYGKGSPVLSKVHEQIVAVVSQSGVGPANNETIAHFLTRAQESIATHASSAEHLIGMHNLHVPIHKTFLYGTPNGNVVAFGGDFNARAMLAYEYLSGHPGAHVLAENVAGTRVIDMSSTQTIVGKVMTTSRPGTFIPPLQFAENIKP